VIRQPALQPLSRDHHQALAIALKLARCNVDSAAEAQSAFLRYWEDDGQGHFRAEEEVLLPLFATWGDPDHPLVAQVLHDHLLIRRRALHMQRRGLEPLWRMRELGVLLSEHVRLEERELFPLIEEYLPPEDLDWLVQALTDDAHALE